MVQKFYDLVSLEVCAGWVTESSVYMEVGFIEVAYAFWHMIFEVAVGSGYLDSVLGSDLCTGYNDLFVPID